MGRSSVRIFKNKWFARFARKEGISEAKLREAVKDAEAGNIGADYGGGVIKQRIARPNEGKSGGYRSVILYRRGDKAFFVYGFLKSERENINEAEEQEFKKLAKVTFAFSDDELTKLIKKGAYKEVKCDD
jgi:hypothetical protein